MSLVNARKVTTTITTIAIRPALKGLHARMPLRASALPLHLAVGLRALVARHVPDRGLAHVLRSSSLPASHSLASGPGDAVFGYGLKCRWLLVASSGVGPPPLAGALDGKPSLFGPRGVIDLDEALPGAVGVAVDSRLAALRKQSVT